MEWQTKNDVLKSKGVGSSIEYILATSQNTSIKQILKPGHVLEISKISRLHTTLPALRRRQCAAQTPVYVG